VTQRGQVPGNPYGNAIAHARQQLQFGISTAAIEGQLSIKYPSLDQVDIRSALLAAQTARQLGRQLTAGQTSGGGLVGGVPINPGIPSAYQYIVNVTYGVYGGNELRTRTIVINTNALLTKEDLTTQSEQIVRDLDGSPQLNTDMSMIDWQVPPAYRIDAVYRRDV
jgi:hypothetical protein